MTHTTEDLGPLRKAATITIPAATLAGFEKTIAKNFAAQVRLPGFRPGKAPLDLVRRQFAKAIADELRQKVAHETLIYLEGTFAQGIHSFIDANGMAVTDITADATVKVTLDLEPEIVLPEYKGLDLPLDTPSVSVEEEETALESLRSAHSKFEVVDRPAQDGDYVKLAYTGTVDGTPVKELEPKAFLYGTQTATWEEAGTGNTAGIPEIATGIIGKKAGDKAAFTHTFPDNEDGCPFEKLRGKTAAYDAEIFEVRSKIPPELDEEFFKQMKVADLEALKTQIRDGILRRKQNETENAQRQKTTDLLNALTPDFPLPESAVEKLSKSIHERDLRNKKDDNAEEAPQTPETDVAEVSPESRAKAEKILRTSLILGAIAKKEKLQPTDEESAQAIYYSAYEAGCRTEKELRDYTHAAINTPAFSESLRKRLLDAKALNFVIDNAKGAKPEIAATESATEAAPADTASASEAAAKEAATEAVKAQDSANV